MMLGERPRIISSRRPLNHQSERNALKKRLDVMNWKLHFAVLLAAVVAFSSLAAFAATVGAVYTLTSTPAATTSLSSGLQRPNARDEQHSGLRRRLGRLADVSFPSGGYSFVGWRTCGAINERKNSTSFNSL
jgi:hypothetical protein